MAAELPDFRAVLDMTRIESGRLALSIEPVSADEVVGESLDLIRPLALERRIELPEALHQRGLFAVADRQRLKQLMLNLLANAVKYNNEGGAISVDVAVAGGDLLRIEVTDTGWGIRQDQLEQVFEPFDRLDAMSREVEGTGLGLALCKGLVEAMDGRVGVKSTFGVGSTFHVELPLAPTPAGADGAPPAPGPPPAEGKSRRLVLHIEDNLSNLELGGDPDTSSIPVVVLSADATPGQVERLLAQGARAYITKPLDVKPFLELIHELVPARG